MASTLCQFDAPSPEKMLKQLEQVKKNLNRMREEHEKQKEFSMKLFRIVCPASGDEKVKIKILMSAVEELEKKRETFLQGEKRFFKEVCECLERLTSEQLLYWIKFTELV